MEGQTNCMLCEYKSRSIGSLKQHMESKHNVFNMTIVQVLTQQVERVNDLESEIKSKEHLIKKTEADLNLAKEELKTEKEKLQEKEKAFNDLITSHRQKAAEESKLVEELHLTKELLTKAHQDLDTKSKALDTELEKVKLKEVSTQTGSKTNEVLKVKEEEIKSDIKEAQKDIPCKYIHRRKGCWRGKKCWFSHEESLKVDKKHIKQKGNPIKMFKDKLSADRESKQDDDSNIQQVMLELIKILLRTNYV